MNTMSERLSNETKGDPCRAEMLINYAMKICDVDDARNRSTFKTIITSMDLGIAAQAIVWANGGLRSDVRNKAAYLISVLKNSKKEGRFTMDTPDLKSPTAMISVPRYFLEELLREYCMHHAPCTSCRFGDPFNSCLQCIWSPCDLCDLDPQACSSEKRGRCVRGRCERHSCCDKEERTGCVMAHQLGVQDLHCFGMEHWG